MSQKFINKHKVAVLLSTYNGHRYMSELIKSILSQTYRDFTIYIRDDGSTDKTRESLEMMSENNDNIVFFEAGQNIGSKRSFLKMVEFVESAYYMFADQDDIWMPEKIQKTIDKMLALEKDCPNEAIIVHTDLQLVDGDLRTIASSYWEYCNIPVDMPHKFEMLCHFNDITGCAMMFNHKAKELSEPYLYLQLPHHVYHDVVIGLAVAKNNGIIYPLHEQTILFRRHGDNETDPLKKNESILHHLSRSVVYLRKQYQRYLFYNQFGYGSFIKFMYYKLLTKRNQNKWKQKYV